MRKLTYIIAFLFVTGFSLVAQDSTPFAVAEKMPEYPGGPQEMYKYLGNNLMYPPKARELNLGGKVFVKFVVETDGNVSTVTVMKSSGYAPFDDEAVRVVKGLKQFTPGSQKGKNVRVYMSLPVNFSMETPYYTWNITDENPRYVSLVKMIFSGEVKEAFRFAGSGDEKTTDPEFIYTRGVLHYHHGSKKAACSDFFEVLGIAEPGTTVYKNCEKFLEKYCK